MRENDLSTDSCDHWNTHALAVDNDAMALLDVEWLLTNGAGSYAMGTAIGANTRRYHGLLIAAAHPPVGRILVLNQMLEQLWLGPREGEPTAEFNVGLFPDQQRSADVCAPAGHIHLKRVDRGLHMCWTYQLDQFTFIRELFLHWKQPSATLRYTLRPPAPGSAPGSAPATGNKTDKAHLRLSPMTTLRDFHSLLQADQAGDFTTTPGAQRVTVQRADVSAAFACSHGAFETAPDWWRRTHYPIETERGQDDVEDLFVPGGFAIDLAPQTEHVITLTASLGDQPVEPCCSVSPRAAHLEKTKTVLAPAFDANQSAWRASHYDSADVADLHRALVVAADDFVVDRLMHGNRQSTILAGYPWFADWGRDTFIALPGLLLATGRFDEACSTLRTFAGAIRNGLIPNRFDDYDDAAAHYNTVDASLWFIHAALQYMDATDDKPAWTGWLKNACLQIIDAYLKGTDNEIKTAGDGLIVAGSMQTQLTWMDAACNGQVFTPRPGKAVEINALWHNALLGLAQRMQTTDRATAVHYQKIAKRITRAFAKVFWNDDLKYCRDHVWIDEQNIEHADGSLRPNQILVAALPRSPLPRTKQQLIVKAVGEHLLTPFGLRTLPMDHPHYHPHYAGPQPQRDQAYHQGTVWPWLIGPYAEAVLRVGKFSDQAKEEALQVVSPLLDALLGRGSYPTFGQLYEIHEAAPPHRPVGCMAQAWSIAEVLRVLQLIASE